MNHWISSCETSVTVEPSEGIHCLARIQEVCKFTFTMMTLSFAIPLAPRQQHINLVGYITLYRTWYFDGFNFHVKITSFMVHTCTLYWIAMLLVIYTVWIYLRSSVYMYSALFYYILSNLEPRLRSALHGIQLVAIVTSPLLEKYGMNTILELFMTAIKELEKVNTSL